MKFTSTLQILFIIGSMNIYSQRTEIKKADKNYENYAFIDAIKTYERVAEKGYKDVNMFKKLGNAYYFNAELDKANKWYAELFAMTNDLEPEYYYRYSQTLKSVGEYAKADELLNQFNTKSGNDLRAMLYMQNKDYLKKIEGNSGRYSIENAGINSAYCDYGTTIFGNKLIFTSSRIVKSGTKMVYKWNNQAFSSLYTSTINKEGQLQAPEEFASNIDSKFNESTPVFTKDGTTMYFTRNNYNDGKERKNKEKATLLKLYKAKLRKGKYTDVKELPFSSDQYNTAHPALSPDEKTLYFASDMPGSFGQSDLYKVSINNDGSFGTPENLGNKINTEGKETFPFISDNNELYFSSDGHPGLGGLDIFVSKIDKNDFGEVVNIGIPVNGPKDDFAFYINTKDQFGFFSSNREGGLGFDDIYKFRELKKFSCAQLLSSTIIDASTRQAMENAKLTLLDEKMNVIKEAYSNAEGKYVFDAVECGKVYYIRGEKKDYNTIEKVALTGKETGKTEITLELEPTIMTVKKGDDLAKVFNIKVIYFDLDKWNISSDAPVNLAKIVDVMNENPTMKIAIKSHTDSRQDYKYNQILSDKRAQSTMKWMINKGISANRLTAKGYGETELVNRCADGVLCNEEEHKANRRSEFIITSL